MNLLRPTLSNDSRRSSSSFLTAQSIYTPRSSGVFREVPDSEAAFATVGVRSYPDDVLRTSSDAQEGSRASHLLGTDTGSTSNLAMDQAPNLMDIIVSDDPDAFQQGLKDALGKDGQWLKSSSEANEGQSEDDGRPSSSLRPSTSHTDDLRTIEEGLQTPAHINHETTLTPNSPVKNISRAVKLLSSRIMNGSDNNVPPRASSPSPQKPRASINSPRIGTPHLWKENFDRESLQPMPVAGPSSQTATDGYFDQQAPFAYSAAGKTGGSIRAESIASNDSSDSGDNRSTSPPEPLPIKLVGSSLKWFSPESKFRLFLYRKLQQKWVEPFTFFLVIFQTVILTIENSRDIFIGVQDPNADVSTLSISLTGWFFFFAQLALFLCYTLLILAKIIAYGLWNDSQRKLLFILAKRLQESPDSSAATTHSDSTGFRRHHMNKNTPVVRTFANLFADGAAPNDSHNTIQPGRIIQETPRFQVATQRAYLRSSWARVDFIAVISYWISLFLLISDTSKHSEIFLFRLLCSLPILRLLNFTRGTASILRSLKVAAPLLVNVGVFVGFFW